MPGQIYAGDSPEPRVDPGADVADGETGAGPPIERRRSGLERGASIGRYLILDEVGVGGMGVVLKAHDPDLDRQVALKLIRVSGKEQTAVLHERLVREAQALARVSHPNVVAVHDVGSFGRHVFLAMEFVDGKTMHRWLKEEPRARRAIVEVFCAAGEGLAAAHRAGLVHRDFKPDNVMISGDGRVRVLDFGLVRAANVEPHRARPPNETPDTSVPPAAASATSHATPKPDASVGPDSPLPSPAPSDPSHAGPSRTRDRSKGLLSDLTSGAIMGTPRYMAPEQHCGDEVDGRADQFSFCLALYEALYGGVDPFAAPSPPERVVNVVEGRLAPPPPEARVPSRLRAILLRGLSPSAADRWPSMDALLAELRKDPAAAWRKAAALTALTVAFAAVVFVSAFAIHARRAAAKQAELAHEFGQEEAQMAATARIAALLPLHDLRPEMAGIRARMAAIEQHMKDLGPVATGPGHYALGRGFVTLERWDDAVRELEAASAAGYRSPDLSYSLGLSHGKLYQKALGELVKTEDDAVNAAARGEIARSHRDPALRYLTEASQSGGATKGVANPEVAQGLIALYERRYEDALALAHRASEESPSLFEARTLEGDIEVAISDDRDLKGDVDGDQTAIERADEAYKAALETARSSAAALTGECRLLVTQAWRENQARRSPETAVKAALAACDAALTALPDDATLLAQQARAWGALLFYRASHGGDIDPPFAELRKRAEAALRIDPNHIGALQVLSTAFGDVSDYRRVHGEDSGPAIEQSIAYARRALAIDKTKFSLYTSLANGLSSEALDDMKRGIDPRPALAAQVDTAKEQRRYFPQSLGALNALEGAHLALAQWERDHGVPPEEELKEGIRSCQEEIAASPKIASGYINLCFGEWVYGSYLARVGEDPRAHLDRAISACNQAISITPADWIARLDLGVSASALANWEVTQRSDASAAIDQARGALKRALEIDPNNLNYRYAAELELVAARAAISRGDDPTPAFFAAEAAARKVLSTDHDDPDALRALADIDRRRAEWLVDRKRPADAALRDGLDAATRAERLTPDVAESFALEGALRLITARIAGRSTGHSGESDLARIALGKAIALDGFLSRDYQPLLAEATRLGDAVVTTP